MTKAIIYAIMAMFVVYWMERRLYYREDENGKPTTDVAWLYLTEGQWFTTVLAGLAVGVITHFTLNPPDGWTFIPGFLAAVLLAAMFYVAKFWGGDKGGSRAIEMAWFAALEVILFIIAMDGAKATAAAIKSGFLSSVVMVLPIVFLIGALGYILANYYLYRSEVVDFSEDNPKPRDEQEDDSEFHGKVGKWVTVGTIILILAILAGAIAGNFSELFPSTKANTDKDEPEATGAATQEEATGGLDPMFVQVKEGPHGNFRVIDDFEGKAQECAKKHGRDEAEKEDYLEVMSYWLARDVSILTNFASGEVGLWHDPNDITGLLHPDGRFTDKAIELYWETIGEYTVALWIFFDEAPAGWFNSGFNNGRTVWASSPGLTGDTKYIHFVFRNGGEDNRLRRCANQAKEKPGPKDEEGPTDEKKPSEDPVNKGNAQKGGGDNKPSDGPGEVQPVDPRIETPQVQPNANGEITPENNNHGHIDPEDVVPETPEVVSSHQHEEQKDLIVDHEEKMDYEPDPITDRGPVNLNIDPTPSSEGAGEFTPDD